MALFRSSVSEQVLKFPFRTTVTIELNQSMGSVTLVMWPSASISFSFIRIFADSAFGRRLGPCTTGVNVGSILMEYVPWSVPVVFLSSGYLSSSLVTSCILSIRPSCSLACPDNNDLLLDMNHELVLVWGVWRNRPLWLGDVCTIWICERSSLLVYRRAYLWTLCTATKISCTLSLVYAVVNSVYVYLECQRF